MLLISFAVFLDILHKRIFTSHVEELIPILRKLCFHISLFKKMSNLRDYCRIVSNLIKSYQ